MGEICNQTTSHFASLKTQRLRHVSKVGCNGDSDETDVKSGAITAQQGGLAYHLNIY